MTRSVTLSSFRSVSRAVGGPERDLLFLGHQEPSSRKQGYADHNHFSVLVFYFPLFTYTRICTTFSVYARSYCLGNNLVPTNFVRNVEVCLGGSGTRGDASAPFWEQ
jgi:hypothetical protein